MDLLIYVFLAGMIIPVVLIATMIALVIFEKPTEPKVGDNGYIDRTLITVPYTLEEVKDTTNTAS